MKKRLLSIVVLMAAGALSSWAIPVSLDIDFRSASWAGANGHQSHTVAGVTARAILELPLVGNIAGLYQDSIDGLGVKHLLDGSADEIDSPEKLKITFGGTSGQGLTGVWVTDLFGPPDGSTRRGEKGEVTIDLFGPGGIMSILFYGDDSDQANGEQFISFGGPVDLEKAVFRVPTGSSKDDFSVAGFARTRLVPSAVPDGGSTLMLLGMAMVGVNVLRRKLSR